MKLTPQGNYKYYSIGKGDIDEVVKDEFGKQTIEAAISYGISASVAFAETLGYVGRGFLNLGKSAYQFTESAAFLTGPLPYIVGTCRSWLWLCSC